MPILKWKTLEDIILSLPSTECGATYSTNTIARIIAQKIGVSQKTRETIMKSLAEFDFIKEKSAGIWEITWKREKQ